MVGLVKEEAKEGARGKLVLLAGGLEEGKEDVVGRGKRKKPPGRGRDGAGLAGQQAAVCQAGEGGLDGAVFLDKGHADMAFAGGAERAAGHAQQAAGV